MAGPDGNLTTDAVAQDPVRIAIARPRHAGPVAERVGFEPTMGF